MPHSVPTKLDIPTLQQLLKLLEKRETLHIAKVIDLARRLHPGLTAEDIRNPHDFPELDDPDWHYEDGQLAGIQSVLTLVRQLLNEGEGQTGSSV